MNRDNLNLIHLAWWGAIVVVMGIGAWLYFTGHDLGLPLYESKDERRNITEVFILRGIDDGDLWKPGYPPGILYINEIAQQVTENITGESALVERCMTILTVRRIGIVFNLLSALLIALIARRIGGNFAGVIAATGWLFSEHVMTQTQFGFPQTYELFSYLLALYLGMLAINYPEKDTELNRWHVVYAILSVLAGLVAVIFKYTAFPVLGFGVGAALWNARDNRKLWLSVIALQFAIILACGLWLLFGYDAVRLTDTTHVETNNVLTGRGFSNLSDINVLKHRFSVIAQQAGLRSIFYIGFLLIGTILYLRKASLRDALVYLSIPGLIVVHYFSLVIFLSWDNLGMRQNLPITGYSTILVAVAIIYIARLTSTLTKPVVGYATGTVLALFWLIPNIVNTVDYVQWRDLPVSHGELVAWAGQTLDSRDILLVSDARPFSDEWSCYAGEQHQNIREGMLSPEQSVMTLREEGVAYVQIDGQGLYDLQVNEWGQTYLNELTLIAQFPPENEVDQWRTWRRGSESHELFVYSTVPIENPLNLQFGESIRLGGYTIESDVQSPGDTLQLRLFWEAIATISTDYDLYIELASSDDPTNILSRSEFSPAGNANRPTSTWNQAGEIMITGRIDIPISADIDAGEYVLYIGLFDAESGEALSADDTAGALEIGRFSLQKMPHRMRTGRMAQASV